MINKPKYHLFLNTKYALDGLYVALKSETSFKIEVILFVILQIGVFLSHLALVYKMILSVSLFLPLIAELINTAIERVVDMYTKEFHPLAKEAKDLGSSVVFVSISLSVIIWIYVIILNTL